MNYFNIQPITLNVSPFETKTVKYISWKVTNLERGANSAFCFCSLLIIPNTNPAYTWKISIPKSVLDLWLDDSVIDDYICSTDARFVKI